MAAEGHLKKQGKEAINLQNKKKRKETKKSFLGVSFAVRGGGGGR